MIAEAGTDNITMPKVRTKVEDVEDIEEVE